MIRVLNSCLNNQLTTPVKVKKFNAYFLRQYCAGIDCVTPVTLIGAGKKMSTGTSNNEKKALVVIAEGSEEIEAVTPIDILRRAGIAVTVAGLHGSGVVKCSRNVNLVPDLSFEDAVKQSPFDAVILPGGLKGAESFGASVELGAFLKEQEGAGRLLAAVCAAPTALKKHGIATGKSITSYPSTKAFMQEGNVYTYKEDRVVVDGNLITSRGPGTSLEFSLAIVEYLVGKDKSSEIANGVLLK